MRINEDTVEQAAIDWFKALGYDYVLGPEIAPGEPGAERASYGEVLLKGRLRRALARINTHIPRAARSQAVETAIGKLEKPEGGDAGSAV